MRDYYGKVQIRDRKVKNRDQKVKNRGAYFRGKVKNRGCAFPQKVNIRDQKVKNRDRSGGRAFSSAPPSGAPATSYVGGKAIVVSAAARVGGCERRSVRLGGVATLVGCDAGGLVRRRRHFSLA